MNHIFLELKEQGLHKVKDFPAHTLFSSILPLVAEFLLFPLDWCGMQLGLKVKQREQGRFDVQFLSWVAALVVPPLERHPHIPVTH